MSVGPGERANAATCECRKFLAAPVDSPPHRAITFPSMVSPEADAVLGEVRAEMARQRKRQLDIAEATGQSVASLSRKLNGHSHFRLGELNAVCRALDVSLADLIRRAENRGTA